MLRKRIAKKPSKKETLQLIESLFAEAASAFKTNPELANNKVKKAIRAGQRARTSIPSKLKKSFCKHCKIFWMPGQTVRVRLQKQKVVYYCFACKHHTRHPYVRERKAKRTISH